MSSCISSHGEYSEHEITTTLFTCDRCGSEDTEAMRHEIDRLNATIQRVRDIVNDKYLDAGQMDVMLRRALEGGEQ